jgi:hypothetical protein
LRICSGSPNNDFAAWGDNTVKSVKVPAGRTLSMFDAKNLEGGYT